MSFEQQALKIENVSKTFSLYEKPIHRLLASLRLLRRPVKKIHGLTDVHLQVNRGEVLGVIGRNGAGKSTLLQLICGTLRPTAGEITTRGRIAALLELGAGFNLEFTGRENVKLSAALMGLGPSEIAAKFDSIVAFAELEQFIDQPVKTYSSGMFVRLAFAVATSVEPDILVIDEALSVGDGVFARKSFDRIMALKARGTTILFCSHALYQVEALSDRVVWLKDGRIQAVGLAHDVIAEYQQFLLQESMPAATAPQADAKPNTPPPTGTQPSVHRVELKNHTSTYRSALDSIAVDISINPAPQLPPPTVAVLISNTAGLQICSFSTHIDKCPLREGQTSVQLELPHIPLLKGEYDIDVFLLCERGIHVYEHVRNAARFKITQDHLEVGLVHIPRNWHTIN